MGDTAIEAEAAIRQAFVFRSQGSLSDCLSDFYLDHFLCTTNSVPSNRDDAARDIEVSK